MKLVRQSQNFVAVFGDEDGVFTVATDGTVAHFDGPVIVFVDVISRFAKTRHRFDADSVAFD